MAMGIERPQTATEKADFERLGTKSRKDVFLAELALVEQTFAKKSLPFDGQCAKADFNEEIEMRERESERIHGFILKSEMDKAKILDLEKYGDKSRFVVVREDEETEMVNLNGIRSSVKTGFTVMFKCKRRGHGISVFMTTEVYEKWKGVKALVVE